MYVHKCIRENVCIYIKLETKIGRILKTKKNFFLFTKAVVRRQPSESGWKIRLETLH